MVIDDGMANKARVTSGFRNAMYRYVVMRAEWQQCQASSVVDAVPFNVFYPSTRISDTATTTRTRASSTRSKESQLP